MPAQTVDLPKRLPLVVYPENRANSTDKDSRLVNGYIEKQKDGDYYIYRRPGLLRSSQPSGGAAAGRGVFYWRGSVYSIFAATLYKDGVAVSGSVDTTNGVYRFDQCLGATPKMQLGNGVLAYNYDTTNGLVQITDGDFPASFCKGWAYLNGFTYVMTPDAAIYQDETINTPEDWNPLDVIIAQIEPDMGVALGKQLVYVIAFKQWSVEAFYDAGNATGSSLARVEGAKVDFGIATAESLQKLDSRIVWITANQSPLRQVGMMEGLRATIISSPAVDRLLTDWDLTTVYSWQVMLNGHRFYVVTSVVSNLTLACDVDELMWYQWTDTNGNYLPIVASTYDSSNNAILQHESNGRLYTMSPAQYTDDGDFIPVDIYTPDYDGGTNRIKNLNALVIQADQVTGSSLEARYNDNDYDPAKWSNFRKIDLGVNRPLLTNCGSFRRRAYHFRHKLPVAFRLQAVDLQIDVGSI